MLLLDTNIFGEIRKVARNHPKANPGVAAWYRTLDLDTVHTSVVVIGEMHNGVELTSRRGDPRAAEALRQWVHRLEVTLGPRILPIDVDVARQWGRLGVPNPVATADGLIAATALVHGMTVVTRNIADFSGTSVAILNPFTA